MGKSTAAAPSGATIVWFRRDLRLADHPALNAAVRTGLPVIPVYILANTGRLPGGASRWWLHESLASLATDLLERGSRLTLLNGDPCRVLPQFAAASGATHLFFNRATTPEEAHTARTLADLLGGHLDIHACEGDTLHAPGTILSGGGGAFRVFTPFWRACQRTLAPTTPTPAPRSLRAPPRWPPSERLKNWQLQPATPDWAAGLRARWQPGEASAQRSLRHFVDKSLADYPQRRDRCDLAGTSALSPHLHFGEIGPRQIWHALRSRAAGDSRIGAGAEAFLRQIGWREFSIHLLHHWPDLATRPFQPAYAQFPWRRAPAALRRWQRGHTGYPLVDAGMRELWTTGWMHNRVRMITASFLVKHLLIHWREGEAWFWDTLVDADLANNAASWQWVAGCGADAAPYFRIFNPVLQGQKFDPQGDYVRRWLPELARLPARYLHAPWQADPATLKSAGVGLGKDYPLPIVEHRAARERALAAVRSISGTRGSPRAR